MVQQFGVHSLRMPRAGFELVRPALAAAGDGLFQQVERGDDVGTMVNALGGQRLQAPWAVALARIRLPLRTRSGVDRVPVPGGLPPRAQTMNARLDPAGQVTLMGPAVAERCAVLLRSYRAATGIVARHDGRET